MTDKAIIEKLNNLESKIDLLMSIFEHGKAKKADCTYTLHTWLDEWYKIYKEPNLAPNTLGTLDVAIRVHIKPNLPDIPLNLLNGLELQKFFTTMTQSRTRKLVFDVLNSSLKDAQNLDLISDNPMKGVKIPPHRRVQGKALSNDEQKTFLQNITGHWLEHYFKFLLYTGCRRNEGLSLNKKDIDLKNKQIHIRGTKTSGSNRTIPLFENVASLLATLKPQKDGIYFDFRPDSVTRIFKKFCPNHKLHDLRHTFATNCLSAEIPLKVVQIWLGHSEIDTTADIYTHVTQEIDQTQAKALNAYYSKKDAQ